jgi:hypothetical protein
MLEKYRADFTIVSATKAAVNGTSTNSRVMSVNEGVSYPIRVEALFEINSKRTKLSIKPTMPLAKPFKINLPNSLDSLKNSESNPIRKAGHMFSFHLPPVYKNEGLYEKFK